MNYVRFVVAGLCSLALALTGSPADVSRADNAPGYETPEGLAIGVPDTTVRMGDEQVNVQVVERGDAAVAVVTATFDMVNDGPTVQLLTGFPNQYTVQDGVNCCYLIFSPASISNFRAWTDAATYTPTTQKIAAGPYKDYEWFVWSMSYPHGKTLPVHVSYEQKLGAQNAYGYVTESVYVFYVLRTGALWSGNIDRAHITFDAPNGGAFVGADGASTASTDHIEWDFTNFKPTSDVGTAYVFATPWKEIQAAEAAVNQPGAGPTEFLRAAQDAALLLGPAQHPNGPEKWLEQRYGSLIQQWATNASVLGTADSWKALGDAELFASGTIWRFGMRCWPDEAAANYQRAADLGSDAAAEQLASLHSGGDHGLPPGVADASSKPSCGSHQAGDESGAEAPAAPVAEVGPEAGPSGGSSQGAPDTLTDEVRGDILTAVDRANAAWTAASQSLDPSALNGNVAGQELRNDLAELDKLRSQGQKRKNLSTVFTVTDVTLDAAGHAIVRTHETWYAEISNAASGRLVQRTPATTYDETYTVEYLSGKWIVTKNEL